MPDLLLEDRLYPDAVVAEPKPTEAIEPEVVVEPEVVEPDAEEIIPEAEGEQSETDDTTTEVEQETELHTVKTRGVEKQVNLTELKNGYQRNEDYAIATRELKDKEKALVEKDAKATQTLQVLTDIQGELDALIMGDVKNIHWDELRQTDTAEYLRLKELMDERKQSLSKVTEKRDQLLKARAAEESTALFTALGWNEDVVKRDGDIKQITDYMTSEGITEPVTSSKLMVSILKAAKYDQLQKTKREVVKEVKAPPKVTKPIKSAQPAPKKSLEERLYANS